MIAKINPRYILKDHLATLGGEGASRDMALFYGLPGLLSVVAGVAYMQGWAYPGNVFGSLRATLSVFTPLLFNVLMLAFYMAREPERHDFPELQPRLIKEVYANTAYAIFVALSALVLLLLDGLFTSRIWEMLIAVPVTALAVNFGLTLFMILKRMHVLMERHA